jgi:hypothetical protein
MIGKAVTGTFRENPHRILGCTMGHGVVLWDSLPAGKWDDGIASGFYCCQAWIYRGQGYAPSS